MTTNDAASVPFIASGINNARDLSPYLVANNINRGDNNNDIVAHRASSRQHSHSIMAITVVNRQ